MEFADNTYSVLVVSSSEKFNTTMGKLLPENRYYPVRTVTSAAAANRLIIDIGFDIVIINAPLPDEFGTRIASELARKSRSGVVLFVRSEHYHDISARLTPLGVMTLSKPADAKFILETLLLLCGTIERMKRLTVKSVPFEEKMAEIRLINQSKMILMSEKGMTEAEAHRYIEKTAMDNCLTRRAVAQEIIKGNSLK